MGHIEIQTQLRIAVSDHIIIDIKLIASILDRRNVLFDTCESTAAGNVFGINDVTRHPLIISERAGQPVLEESIVNPGIETAGLFPTEVVVTQLGRSKPR